MKYESLDKLQMVFIRLFFIQITFDRNPLSHTIHDSIFEDAEVFSVIVELWKKLVVENLRFYCERCQCAFGFYLRRAIQTVFE
jgi:hypothetical protein